MVEEMLADSVAPVEDRAAMAATLAETAAAVIVAAIVSAAFCGLGPG